MNVTEEKMLPAEIERRSFEIIGAEMGDTAFSSDQMPVVKRVIHTTADFDYLQTLYFSPDAVQIGIRALKAGAHIVTDTQMAKSGVNKTILSSLGGQAHCFMSDEDVALLAKEQETTRAAVSMDKAAALSAPLIFAIGNAPTALFRIARLVEEGRLHPQLVIAVPVGFVNVVESKERIIGSGVPCIVARGRKGGSNVAAAICNALLYQIKR